MSLWRDSQQLRGLGKTGLRVLECLARHAPDLVARDELLTYGWEGTAVGDASLSKQIRQIRGILQDVDKTLVLTHHGQGFALQAEVTALEGRSRGVEAPPLPEHPYPLLRPYDHPALFAGREREVEEVLARLRGRIPILGLYSVAGAGKSSLLRAGILPALREAGVPVAYHDHPAEPGAIQAVIAQTEAESLEDEDDFRAAANGIKAAGQLTGSPPVIVLDQFEDVLKLPPGHSVRARWGLILAASMRGHTGIDQPPCRWLLAYRGEYEGQVKPWLGDVLDDARRGGFEGTDDLPSDLSRQERFDSAWLAPFGATVDHGSRADTAHHAFLRAILKPLEIKNEDGTLRYRWRFKDHSADRLAAAFAEARLHQPEAPLVPELQVVLAHLLARAGEPPPGELAEIEVAEGEAPTWVRRALERHLRRAIVGAYPGDSAASARSRGHALLALRQLARGTGERGGGLESKRLAAALGPDGLEVLELLASAEVRLLTPRQGEDGLRYELSHDSLAKVVVDTVERDPTLGGHVDVELVALRRVVALRAEQFETEEERTASTRLSRSMFAAVSEHAEALLWTEQQRNWWLACIKERRRRNFRYRLVGITTVVVLGAMLLAGLSVRRSFRSARLIQEVKAAEAPVALEALVRLDASDWDDPRLAEALEGGRFARLIEEGILAVPLDARPSVVLELVSMARPRLGPELERPDFFNLGAALWSLDAYPGRESELKNRTEAVKRELLAPLGEPPLIPAASWACIQGGSFVMGSDREDRTLVSGKADTALHRVTVSGFKILRHEVTNRQMRALQPERQANEWPAGEVSWYQAAVFAAWIGGRLATEAEWEFAARGTESRLYPWGNEPATCSRARFDECKPEEAIEVCQLEAGNTPEGVCDLAGNVWEWVGDWYGKGEYPKEERDPWGLDALPPRRVFRGGGFTSSAVEIRSALRLRGIPRTTANFVGFRVVIPGSC